MKVILACSYTITNTNRKSLLVGDNVCSLHIKKSFHFFIIYPPSFLLATNLYESVFIKYNIVIKSYGDSHVSCLPLLRSYHVYIFLKFKLLL